MGELGEELFSEDKISSEIEKKNINLRDVDQPGL